MENIEKPRGPAVHTFKEVLQGREVFFYVLQLQQSFLIWVGGHDGGMEVLAVAMQTPHDTKQAAGCTLVGSTTDGTSTTVAQRLAKLTNCQCFVSINLTDQSLIPLVEAALVHRLQTSPGMFYCSH